MSKGRAHHLIRLRGVRHNNLKNFDLDLPTGHLIVITGLSGSGKSSLAFDTLYAEGQRRYIETFSPYARQFFDRMDKPQVDSIHGIPPAIAIEQRNAVKSTRSTVGTMTEICDYMKVVWAHWARLYCRGCRRPVRKDEPPAVWEHLMREPPGRAREFLVTFQVPVSDKLTVQEMLDLITKQGYQRLLWPELSGAAPRVVRVEEASELLEKTPVPAIQIVQDRVKLAPINRARFIEACEQAYHLGKGQLCVYTPDSSVGQRFSNRLHCAECDIEYRPATSALFSFNHPVGACPTCRGFGRTITIDYGLAIPDPALTLEEGAVKPWQSGQSAECQDDLLRFCAKRKVPIDVPFVELKAEWQRWVIDGDPGYGSDAAHEWPHAWYGVKGYFRWLESKAYKMHVRVLLSRYRTYQPCLDCKGQRFQPDSLLFKCSRPDGRLVTLADFYQLTVSDALAFMHELAPGQRPARGVDPIRLVVDEVCSRLSYLEEVGVGYLSLGRPTRSLSGGETERVNLTTCLGARLVNTLFVLDEPSVGLHARDTRRLALILERLRDAGNTVVVVEHDPALMRAADQLVDLGPGHGEAGGALVFQGTCQEIAKSSESLTGKYLSGALRIRVPKRRAVAFAGETLPAAVSDGMPCLDLRGANQYNLKNLTVRIPLGRFVCVTGVSGSGKTTLIREVLLPLLTARFKGAGAKAASANADANGPEDADDSVATTGAAKGAALLGWEHLGRVVLVDQAPLGKTPRSNPAVYIGAFDFLRELFAQSEAARQRGLNASAFSFNSRQGQCEQCRGAGFEKVEMQFLSDIYIRCPACEGRRYRDHILEVKLVAPAPPAKRGSRKSEPSASGKALNISELLQSTIDETVEFLSGFGEARAAQRALERLKVLQEVGLGYLRLGQPINTLSGGESQRLKLSSHLAEFAARQERDQKPTLFLLDEPTTGLHFADVEVLINVFQRLVDKGHSVLVVEHNLDLIKCADWVIDLGPEAGSEGGQIVGEGTPEQIRACPASHTGRSLAEVGI